jgi:hypothetical protein
MLFASWHTQRGRKHLVEPKGRADRATRGISTAVTFFSDNGVMLTGDGPSKKRDTAPVSQGDRSERKKLMRL